MGSAGCCARTYFNPMFITSWKVFSRYGLIVTPWLFGNYLLGGSIKMLFLLSFLLFYILDPYFYFFYGEAGFTTADI